MDPSSYATHLKGCMRTLRCTPSRQLSHPSRQNSSALDSASHVFVRHDAVKKPLQQPYDGPFPVLTRADRYYTLDLNGRTDSVSVDRLKPAYVDFPINNLPTPTLSSAAPSASPASMSSQPSQRVPLVCPDTAPVPSATRTTKSGRRVHWPTRLRDFAP